MEIAIRAARSIGVCLLTLFLLAVLPLGASPALARNAQDNDTGQADASKMTERERARQARIDEYLRKKEERRARRELNRQQKAAEKPEPVDERMPAGVTLKDTTRWEEQEYDLPRPLAEAQSILWESDLAQDPNVADYLRLIDRSEASPHQLAAFGNFLAQNGMNRLAFAYYDVALGLVDDDPLLWLNVGTLHRQLNENPAAIRAYRRAIELDPTNAYAHYNLGAVFDDQQKYEAAIQEYSVALTLDPTLGDPQYNPQAASNERLLAVKLKLYEQQTGSLGLPLVDIPTDQEAQPGASRDD